MKVFITGVGERDPHWVQEEGRVVKYNDLVKHYGNNYEAQVLVKEGPILSLFKGLKDIKEDFSSFRIYLLPTADREGSKGTEEGARKTKDLLEQLFDLKDQVFIRAINVANPVNHIELYPSVRKIIEEIKEEVQSSTGEDIQYVIDLQPGTPQLGHVFISLAMLGVINPEFLEVKRDGSILKTNLSFIFEDEILKRGLALLKKGFFSLAGYEFAQLEEVAVSKESRRKAKLFYQLCDIFDKWDILKYEEGFETIKNLLAERDVANYQVYENLREILIQQKDSLDRLKKRELEKYVVDLYYNAARRAEQGNFPDTLWRFTAIYEVVLRLKAIEAIRRNLRVDLDPENFAASAWPHRMKLKGILKDVFGLPNYDNQNKFFDRIETSLESDHARKILECIGDPFLNLTSSLPTKDIYQKRNLLVHGLNFPQENEVISYLKIIKEFVQKAFGLSKESLQEYSLSPRVLEKIANILQQIYVSGLS